MSESDAEESLGPLEPAYPSPAFKRNYTAMLIQGSEMWNDWFIPFKLYPQLPFDTFLPSDAKFIGELVTDVRSCWSWSKRTINPVI